MKEICGTVQSGHLGVKRSLDYGGRNKYIYICIIYYKLYYILYYIYIYNIYIGASDYGRGMTCRASLSPIGHLRSHIQLLAEWQRQFT
jgi:hypothetical protein